MLDPPAKKRKIANNASGCARRSTRSQRPVLSIELISKVATFAPYGNDLMNICMAVGPSDSALIRHACLRNNFKFLEHRLRQYNATIVEYQQVRTSALAWMAINTDWKTRHCTAENRQRLAIVSEEPSVEDEDSALVHSPRNRGYVNSDLEPYFVVNFDPRSLFNNPMVAIELGLTDILKHLVEEVGIDINAYGLTCYSEVLETHLLEFASRNSVDPAGFRYLMTRPEIDVSLSARPPGSTTKSILLQAIGSKDVDPGTFEALVLHPRCKPNMPHMWVDDTVLPLQYLLLRLAHDHFRSERYVLEEQLKIMLAKTDADPSLHSGGIFPPPIGIVADSIQRRPTEKQRWASIVPLMLDKMSRVDRERYEGLPEFIFE